LLLEPQEMDQDNGHVDDQQPAPWGFWATVGFSCIILIVYVLIQVVVVAAFAVTAIVRNPKLDMGQFAKDMTTSGFLQAVATCAAAPFAIGLMVLFAKIRRQITVKQYLSLHMPGWPEIFKWCLVVVLFVICHDGLTLLLNRPVVPEFMIDIYKTAYFTPLLWLALVVIAPLFEETFFRGFLFKGIENSKMGQTGAIIITSLAWSAMHVQYDIYGIAGLFVGGLLLGFARAKSGSIYPPLAMHALQNIIATVEVVVVLRVFSSGP
jgi:hypothetical protein